MTPEEERLWSDVIRVVNRTSEPLEWLWDSWLYFLKPTGSAILPRHIAMAGVKKYCMSIDPFTGEVLTSLIGIDDGGGKFPCDPITAKVAEVAEQDKLGDEPVIIDGKIIKKKIINLRPYKEDFSHNNT